MLQKGHLVIIDITGYTAFLTHSELEHAGDILKSLLEAMLERVKPPWVVHELEGDAIFTYALDGSFLQAQTLLETVENVYCAFAIAKEHMHLNTTCPCKACEQIPKLDLKIVIHYGSFILGNIGGREKLTGADVVLVHRLLKNQVSETTGIKAYAFLTEACVKTMSMKELVADMPMHTETYEHLGEVNGFVHDLYAVWIREKDKRRVYVDLDDLWFEVRSDLPVPPALAWDYLTEPKKMKCWTQATRVAIDGRAKGRMGIGTGQHCVHGKQTITHTIVDWQPFDYLTTDSQTPLKGRIRQTTQLRPTDDGRTEITWYFGKPAGQTALHTGILRLIFAPVKHMLIRNLKRGREIILQMAHVSESGL